MVVCNKVIYLYIIVCYMGCLLFERIREVLISRTSHLFASQPDEYASQPIVYTSQPIVYAFQGYSLVSCNPDVTSGNYDTAMTIPHTTVYPYGKIPYRYFYRTSDPVPGFTRSPQIKPSSLTCSQIHVLYYTRCNIYRC